MRTVIHRPTRVTAPVVEPENDEELAPPPQLSQIAQGGMALQTLLPVGGAVSSMLMMVVMRGANPVFMLVGSLVFVVAIVSGGAMAFTGRARAQRDRKSSRTEYLDYLEDLRAELRVRSEEVRRVAVSNQPEPDDLPQIISNPERLWERRESDPDFLSIRMGVGNVAWFPLRMPKEENPVQPYDSLMAAEARQVVEVYSLVENMPICVDLLGSGEVSVIGTPESTTALARAMIASIASFHSPEDCQMAICVGKSEDQWGGANLLPHLIMSVDATGMPTCRISTTVHGLTGLLEAELSTRISHVAAERHSGVTSSVAKDPHLVVFVNEHGTSAQPLPLPEEGYSYKDLRLTVVHMVDKRLDESSQTDVRITMTDDQGSTQMVVESPGRVTTGRPDQMTVQEFSAVARMIAPLRLSEAQGIDAEVVPETRDAMRLLGIGDLATLSAQSAWKPRSARDFLRVPIGSDDHGAPLLLDLKESAQLGMGPHGICIGATGSGKSELLRTLVLSLALTHSPEDLSMILVDYKGGAAFAPFASLGHVAGLIDNLQDDPQMTRRARESIEGEVRRRQEVLKAAGSVPSITHYRELRHEMPHLPPLPHLFLVIDEFGELLTAEPDFSALLIKIGRIGRSIGVHLLLASQRLEANALRGLEAYLSYWIGMRTFSEAESRMILGTPDAFALPAVPGYGYLKVDTSVYARFRAGYVSGPAAPVVEDNDFDAPLPASVQVVPFVHRTHLEDIAVVEEEEEIQAPDVGRHLVDEVVDRLAASDMTTSPVWLPPLPTRLPLGAVLTEAERARVEGELPVVIGLLDDPSRQSQAAWRLDLAKEGGHVGIFGAPQSGRSTFLRTVAVSLSLMYTPKDVSIYGIDLSGGGLARLEEFPHVGGIATRGDRERLTRLFEELKTMLDEREAYFKQNKIDSLSAWRTSHRAGKADQLVATDIVVLIDGLEAMKEDYEDLMGGFADLLRRGGGYGIHMVLAMARWADLRGALQSLVGQRIELRLNDPSDSLVGRAAASVLRSALPGRALTRESLYGQVALPLLEDVPDDSMIADAIVSLSLRSKKTWTGPSAAPIRLLPENLDPGELPTAREEPTKAPLGLRQDTMGPVFFDPGTDQHLLVFGDTQCGKTTLLRGLAQGLVDRYGEEDLVFAVMDPRGGLKQAIPEEYLGGYATNTKTGAQLAVAITDELESRSADPSTGPMIILLVDDYDILGSGGTSPLASLSPYLPSARDLRFHIALTRPVAGIGRALYQGILQDIQDSGATGFVMNGSRTEGQIFPGATAEQFPPGRGRLVRRGSAPQVVQIAHFHERVSEETP